MAESFRINAVLNLTSNAVPELAQLGRKFQAFDTVIKESTKQIKAFETALSSLGSSRKIGGLVTALERLGKVHIGNLSGLSGLSHLSQVASQNASGINKMVSSMAKLGTLKVGNLGNVGGHIQAVIAPLTTVHSLHQGIATAAHNTAQAWSTMAGHVRAAAGAMRAMPNPKAIAPTPVGKAASGSHASSGSFSQTVQDAGTGAGMASSYVDMGLSRVYHGGMEAGEALSKLSLTGFNAAEVIEAQKKAFEVQQKVKGSTVGGNLEIMKDVYSVMQDAKEAIASAPEMAKMGVILEKMGKGDQIKELFAAIRAGELAGALNEPGSESIDLGLLTRFMHGLSTVVVKSGGRVTPSDYVQMFQMAGIAGARMSEEARFGTMPAIMMALKATKAGNALQSFQQSELGHLAAGYGQAQVQLGLIEPGRFQKLKGGGMHILPGGLKDSEEFMTNLPHWIWNTLTPLLNKKVNPEGKLSPEQETNASLARLYDYFPRNTITRLVEDIIRNKPLIKKDEASILHDLKTRPDYNDRLDKTDPKLHEQSATAALDAFSKAMGLATTSQSMTVLDGITGALNRLSDWALHNQKDAAFYTDLAAGLAVVTTAIAAMGVAMMVITPAAIGMTAAIGGAAAAGAMAAHFFPGEHKPGETSRADQLLDLFHIKPAGLPKIDWRTGNIDLGLGGYAQGAAPPAAANTNQAGSSSSNPLYTFGINTPSGRDISHGVTDFQGRVIHGPQTGTTGFDPKASPAFSIFSTP